MNKTVGWIALGSYPFKFSSNLVKMNSNIISAPTAHSAQDSDGIYAYNADKDDWDLFFKYPADFESSSHALAYNENTNELYLFGFQATVIKFDINNKQCKIKDALTECYGSYPGSLFVDNTFHIIGGNQNSSHLIYNEQTNTFKSIHTFKHFNTPFPAVIYSKLKNMIILFDNQNVYIYDTHKKEWTTSDTQLPCDVSEFECTITTDDRFAIIFGGYIDGYSVSNKILIMDLDKMKISESKIICPVESAFRGVIIDNYDDDYKLLVSGFIRMYCMKQIPHEMFKIVERFCIRDYLHLVEKDTGKHWKICVDEILFNLHDSSL
eukprot:232190_1